MLAPEVQYRRPERYCLGKASGGSKQKVLGPGGGAAVNALWPVTDPYGEVLSSHLEVSLSVSGSQDCSGVG